MLAYDLHLKNKDYQYEFTGNTLIKKIFVSTNNDKDLIIKMDDTTLQQCGINENDANKLQSVFQMPEKNRAQLPYKSTGSNSSKPYLELEGKFESKKNISKFVVSIVGKKPGKKDESKFIGELVIDESKQTEDPEDVEKKYRCNIAAEDELTVRLNKTDYCAENDIPIYSLYNKNNIIRNNLLDAQVFHKISVEFFNFVKKKWTRELANAREKLYGVRYLLVVLPTSQRISFRPRIRDDVIGETMTIDSFGNESSGFPQESTQTAKFLSFDDPAFSINCKSKAGFYQNLSIGKNSFKTINIPDDFVITISGLSWIFTDLDDPAYRFEQTRKGIFHQLLLNYVHFKRRVGDSYQKQSSIKIICFKKNRAKLEVLLDDNLTMQKMRRIFQTFDNFDVFQDDVPTNLLEILIDKNKDGKPLWSLYINAVRSLLHEKKMDRSIVLSFFIKKIKFNIYEWLDTYMGNMEIKDFFYKSEFCIKILLW